MVQPHNCLAILHIYIYIYISYLGKFIANDITGGFSDVDVNELHVTPRFKTVLPSPSAVVTTTTEGELQFD